MEWLTNLSKAIEYIESHLDKEISYDQAAGIACCSTYYFQRMFSYVAGIPLSEYIRRRRMTQAAFELQRTDRKVIDVALKYGYTSPTSFNRAFQSVHGITPAAAKRPGCNLSVYPMIRLSVTVTGGEAMRYRIEEKDAMRIVGVRTPLMDNMEENHKHVPVFWQEVLQQSEFEVLSRLADNDNPQILGASVYRNPDDIFYYIAVATDKPVPDEMFEYEIPAATWVVFENDGYFKEHVQSTFRRFFMEWLPFSGYDYAWLPDLEVYPLHESHPSAGHSEVWVAVREKKEKEYYGNND